MTAQVWPKKGSDKTSACERSDITTRCAWPIGPFALADRHDFPGRLDPPVPGEAAAVEDVSVGLEADKGIGPRPNRWLAFAERQIGA